LGGARFDPTTTPQPSRNRNFGPDAKPSRGQKAKKRDVEKPRGPIPLKSTGRSFTLDDVDDVGEEPPDMDNIATSKPPEDEDEES
jgi:hypothetical protein